jgi:polyribonucleotide nucleotidyltransferase
VDYRDKFYATGRIPGSFFRREGRPSEWETLRARLIDRSIRPLFPEDFRYEVQVYVTVLSMDQHNPPEIPALVGASVALNMSKVPFGAQIAAVRVGRVQGESVLNPTFEEQEKSLLDLIVAGGRDGITMIEAGANDLAEEHVLESIQVAQDALNNMIPVLDEFCTRNAQEKLDIPEPEINEELRDKVLAQAETYMEDILDTVDKQERGDKVKAAIDTIQNNLIEEYPEEEDTIANFFYEYYKKNLRRAILEEKKRPDGRSLTEVRPIECEVSALPRTHGSAIFTRGQTQSLGVVTLGTPKDGQMIDDLLGVRDKYYMLHYNFPSYSVGEVRPVRGPGRREIGHGALAEKALMPVIPSRDDFPYTVRVVSEILESNGSSSMASVCAGTLSLMDAGVPILHPVAGISIGLVTGEGEPVLLTDILGLEDHFGDMDLKIAGTREGITAIQMDLKVSSISYELLRKAFDQAREARHHILDKMVAVLPEARAELSPYAPRIIIIKIDREKIGELIGPGGKNIKGIVEKTGATIDVDDDGTVYIGSTDGAGGEQALEMVKAITAEVEVDQVYTGKVVRLLPSGALVEVLPNKVGLLHISEIDVKRVEKVEDVFREGDTVQVKVLSVDPDGGKFRLSRRALLPGGDEPRRSHDRRGEGRDRRGGRSDRGDRSKRPPRRDR